jgi:hypothetical protein
VPAPPTTDSQRLTYSGRGGAGNVVEPSWRTEAQRELEKKEQIAKGISEGIEKDIDTLLAKPEKVVVKRK